MYLGPLLWYYVAKEHWNKEEMGVAPTFENRPRDRTCDSVSYQ